MSEPRLCNPYSGNEKENAKNTVELAHDVVELRCKHIHPIGQHSANGATNALTLHTRDGYDRASLDRYK